MTNTVADDAAQSRLIFAVVDAVWEHIRRENWRLRAWPDRARQWKRSRGLLGWWRSAWTSPG